MTTRILALVSVLPSLAALPSAQSSAWSDLFDGDGLDGWSVHGAITCEVQEGALRIEGGLGYLLHERRLGDFELELSVRSESANSGIQVRSEASGSNRFAGYQIEVDPSVRAWSGGLYEAEGRLWLQDLEGRPEAQAAWRQGEWNHYRVLCEGAHIRSWVNGVACTDYLDAERLEGLIALQGHDAGALVYFKDVRVRELGRSVWEPLWDGTSTSGWHVSGAGEWSVRDGVLVGEHAANVGDFGHLVTDERLGDFCVRTRWRSSVGNSGLYFRVDEEGFSGVAGFQAEIDPVRDVGGLYETNGRAWVVRPDAEQVAGFFRPQDWNTTVVSALGARVAVAVNAVRTAELFDDPGRREGHLALQLHGGQEVKVEFASVEILRSYPPGVLELPWSNERAPRETRTLDTTTSWTPPDSLAAWESRRAALQQQLLVSAGLYPMLERAPIEAVVHSAIDRGDYTVEKVYFESFAGFYVTGNLYRPKGPALRPRPAVLCPHGHWADGRFSVRSDEDVQSELDNGGELDPVAARYHLQARMVQLARMGCVVFHYDMVGYADSTQLGVDHADGFGDADSGAIGINPLGHQLFNSIRALDFVEGLSDVDPARIAVTGGSGGGTQTFLLCAVDPRPAVSVPAVMVSMRMQGGCPCENAAHLRLGTNNVELAALFAPRPMLLIGADDWTLHIEEEGEPELEALYELYGARELVDARCHPEFPHNYNRVSRAHVYSWLGEHLGLEDSQEERAFEPLSPDELSVWTAEHPRPANAVDLDGLQRAWSEALVAGLLSRRGPAREQARGRWLDALQVLTHTRLPERGAVALEFDAGAQRDERAPQPVLLRGDGEQPPLRAWLWRPPSWDGRIVVAASDEGPRALTQRDAGVPSLAARSLDAGVALLACAAPTGAGSPRDGWRHEGYPGYTWGYNTTPLARRTDELLTLVAAARDLAGEAGEVRLWTSGAYTDARPLASLLSTGVVAHSAGANFDLQSLAAELPGWEQVRIQEDDWRVWLNEVEAEDLVELGRYGT